MDTVIVSLLRRNCLIRYIRNCGKLWFLIHGCLLYYHYGELIQGQLLLSLILKTCQEYLLPGYPLYHTSQLLS